MIRFVGLWGSLSGWGGFFQDSLKRYFAVKVLDHLYIFRSFFFFFYIYIGVSDLYPISSDSIQPEYIQLLIKTRSYIFWALALTVLGWSLPVATNHNKSQTIGLSHKKSQTFSLSHKEVTRRGSLLGFQQHGQASRESSSGSENLLMFTQVFNIIANFV